MTITLDPTTALVYHLIEQAAAAGARCPQNDFLLDRLHEKGLPCSGGIAPILTRLAKAGLISGAVSGHNWRTLMIHQGPYAGMSTRPNPRNGSHAYMIYDLHGCSRPHRPLKAWSDAV